MSNVYDKPVPPFMPAFATVAVIGTTAASGVTGALPTGAYTAVRVTNEGSVTAFFTIGGSSVVTSSTTGVPILGPSSMVVRVALTSADTPTPPTTVAVQTATSTATLRFTAGDAGLA